MNEAYEEIKRYKLIVEMLRVLYPESVKKAEKIAQDLMDVAE